MIDDNWKVENWIKIVDDKERFNGCKAFQKVLDGEFLTRVKNYHGSISAIREWGEQYTRHCHAKWTDTKKTSWFTRFWKRTVKSLDIKLPTKVKGAFKRGCNLDDGF